MKSLALALLLVLAGRARAQNPLDVGAFVLRINGDTVVIERFARTADTVQGTVALKGQPRLDYTAVLGLNQSVRSMNLMVYPYGAPANATPLTTVHVLMRGDSAIATTDGVMHAFGTTAGAVPLLNNSFAMAELFTRRARAAHGPVTIPIWALSGGQTLTATATPVGDDSVSLLVNKQDQRLKVDAVGRILGGTIPSQHLEILRVDPADMGKLHLGMTDYSAPADAPYRAVDVTLAGQHGISLGGTLTLPTHVTGRVPALITITGSGQQDRDEYIPIVPGGFRPFRQIADTLGRRGIAVLRLDDRMIGMSGGKIGTSADYAEDIRAAIAFLRARSDIDSTRIALLGHSEGGMIAPLVAATDSRLAGIVLMAGPAYRGIDIIHYQQRDAIDADTSVSLKTRDSTARAAAATLDSLGPKDVWLNYFLSYDPLITAAKVRVPVLILQGATDHQVTPEQAEKLAAAMRAGGDADVTVHLFPGLDHLFLPDPNGKPGGYTSLPDNRVPKDVLGTIADWLSTKFGITTAH